MIKANLGNLAVWLRRKRWVASLIFGFLLLMLVGVQWLLGKAVHLGRFSGKYIVDASSGTEFTELLLIQIGVIIIVCGIYAIFFWNVDRNFDFRIDHGADPDSRMRSTYRPSLTSY